MFSKKTESESRNFFFSAAGALYLGLVITKSANASDKVRRLKVAAVQMKFAASMEDNLACIEQSVSAAARKKTDAILFPECATTGYACDFTRLRREQLDAALRRLSTIASDHRINLLVGSPVFHGRHLRNCLVVLNRQGKFTHCYAKCQLTEQDRRYFAPGDSIALFEIDGIRATAVICHERRYPELVRLAVMAGAQVLFHPNAGMDSPAVSRSKRGGSDGIAVRAFENAIYYVFANSVGRQTANKWSAGDSKIVAPGGKLLKLADNESEALIMAGLDMSAATRKYARESLEHPRFLRPHWRAIIRELKAKARDSLTGYGLPQAHG